MVFSSITFLLYFLPVVLGLYYGMTESTGTVSFLGEYKKGACGKVAEHNEVRIVDGEILREAPVEEVIVYANDDNLIAAKIYCGVDEDRQQEVRKCIRKLNRTLPVPQKIKDIVFTEEPLEKSGMGKIKR